MNLKTTTLIGALLAAGAVMADDITLEYMSWDPAQLEIEQAAIAEFEAAHPRVSVKTSAFKSKDYWARLSALAAADDLPDVFMMSSGFVKGWGAAGNMADLSDLVSEDLLAGYYDGAASVGVVDGKRVAFPQNWVAPVMFYNIDMFEEAGVPLPSKNWTWDEFLSAAKALTMDKDGNGSTDQWGMWLYGRYAHVEPWVFRNGGQYLNADETALDLNDAAKNALGFLTSLTNEHKVSPMLKDMQGIRQQDVFPLGMTAMYVDGSWNISNVRKVAGDNFRWGIAQVPVGPDATADTARAYAWADMLSIANNSEHKELAWEFIQHMVGAGRTAADFRGGKVPAYVEIAESEEFLELDQQPANKDLLLSIGAQPVYTGFSKNWSAWRGYDASGSGGTGGMNGELDEVFNGRKALDDAIAAFTAHANDVLSR